jgi:hypothetical protein
LHFLRIAGNGSRVVGAVLKSGVLFFNFFGLGMPAHREASRHGEVNVGGCEVRAESGR